MVKFVTWRARSGVIAFSPQMGSFKGDVLIILVSAFLCLRVLMSMEFFVFPLCVWVVVFFSFLFSALIITLPTVY